MNMSKDCLYANMDRREYIRISTLCLGALKPADLLGEVTRYLCSPGGAKLPGPPGQAGIWGSDPICPIESDNSPLWISATTRFRLPLAAVIPWDHIQQGMEVYIPARPGTKRVVYEKRSEGMIIEHENGDLELANRAHERNGEYAIAGVSDVQAEWTDLSYLFRGMIEMMHGVRFVGIDRPCLELRA